MDLYDCNPTDVDNALARWAKTVPTDFAVPTIAEAAPIDTPTGTGLEITTTDGETWAIYNGESHHCTAVDPDQTVWRIDEYALRVRFKRSFVELVPPDTDPL